MMDLCSSYFTPAIPFLTKTDANIFVIKGCFLNTFKMGLNSASDFGVTPTYILGSFHRHQMSECSKSYLHRHLRFNLKLVNTRKDVFYRLLS